MGKVLHEQYDKLAEKDNKEDQISMWKYIWYRISDWWQFNVTYAGGPKDRFFEFMNKVLNILTFYISPAKDLVSNKVNRNGGKLLSCKYNESYQRSRGEDQIYLYSKVNMFGYVKIIEDYVVDEDGNKINKFLNFTVIGMVDPDSAKEKITKVKQHKKTIYSGFVFTRKKAIKTYLKIVKMTPELEWYRFNPYNSKEDTNLLVFTLEQIIKELRYNNKTSIKELKKKINYVVKDCQNFINIRKQYNKDFEERYEE